MRCKLKLYLYNISHPTNRQKSKNLKIYSINKVSGKWSLWYIAVGMQNGTIPMEESLAIATKITDAFTL